MENNSRETQEPADRRRVFHRVIEKIRNLPKRDEKGTSSSNTQQLPDRKQELEIQQRDEWKQCPPTLAKLLKYRR